MKITNVVLDISRLYAFYSERVIELLSLKIDGWAKLIELALIVYDNEVRDLEDCIGFVKAHYESVGITDREYWLIYDIGAYISYYLQFSINRVVYADCDIRHNYEWYTAELYIGFI